MGTGIVQEPANDLDTYTKCYCILQQVGLEIFVKYAEPSTLTRAARRESTEGLYRHYPFPGADAVLPMPRCATHTYPGEQEP